jgi:MFS family permease
MVVKWMVAVLHFPWNFLGVSHNNMIARLQHTNNEYPRQFWLMFVGMVISMVGASMVWPFLMIYLSENLHAPMTVAASLMTLNSVAGLIASTVAGPVMDRLGRKWIMVFSLLLNGISFYFLGTASTMTAFIVLMILNGIAQPLFRIGGDTMVADLLPTEKRSDGYALTRMGHNVGIAVGPAVGGFLAATSYSLAFVGAAIGMGIYALMLAVFAVETLPKTDIQETEEKKSESGFRGYLTILRDFPFMSFTFGYTLVIIVATLIWVVLPVYAKQNYQISESLYGWIPTTNAVMVVTLQLAVTRITKRHPTLQMLAVGAGIYAISVLSISAGSSFFGFWIGMVIMTVGELVLVPTATTYAANLAPADMRGRYMSVFGLAWRVALGVGPIVGGLLNDNLGPKSIWYGGAVIGVISVIVFLQLQKIDIRQQRTAASQISGH